MELKFTGVYEVVLKEDGGGYVAYFGALPGTHRVTHSKRQSDAIELLLDTNRTLAKESQDKCEL
jgi:hypothetical protein